MTIKILKISLDYLRINGIWPSESTELNPTWYYYFKFLIIQLSTLTLIIGSFLHLFQSTIYNSSYNVNEDLVMIIAEIGGYYFLSCFVVYQKDIARIYNELSDFDKFGKPPMFDERYKILQTVSFAYKHFMDIAIGVASLASFTTIKSCEKINEISEFKQVCGLVITSWMPFNIEDFPYKQMFSIWQVWSLVMTLKGSAIVSFSIMETMEHLIIRLQHLKSLLVEAINEQNIIKREERFRSVVKYHNYILELGQRIDVSYAKCLSLHMFITGALFGCIGYRFVESVSVNVMCLLNGWMLSLIIVCVSGQRLIDESLSVGEVAYNCEWYNLDVSFQKSVKFMIQRSQKPIVVHAGPFTFLSHVLILFIMKTAYSYMTVLNATDKE